MNTHDVKRTEPSQLEKDIARYLVRQANISASRDTIELLARNAPYPERAADIVRMVKEGMKV